MPLYPPKAAAVSPVVSNASWAQATWFIDPANVSGVAADANTGIDATHPVRTWVGGVIAKYGTTAPRLGQTVTYTFMSSHVDDSDPVSFRPTILNGSSLAIQGQLGARQLVGTGTLATLTAKARATGQLLQAGLGALAAQGQIVVNNTRGASRAWIYALVSGTVFSLSQPCAPVALTASASVTEVDTWANTDSFSLYLPVSVNIVDFSPIISTIDPNGLSYCSLYQLNVFDPSLFFGFAYGDALTIGVLTGLVECSSNRTLNRSQEVSALGGAVTNCALFNGMVGGVARTANFSSPLAIVAGIVGGAATSLLTFRAYGATLDSDVIVAGNALFGSASIDLGQADLRKVFIDTGVTLTVSGLSTAATASPIIWGKGILNVSGQGRLKYAGTAASVFLTSGGLRMNGGTTAYSASGTNPATISGGITVSAANLDAAAGPTGFGGNAFLPGGGCITNLGI